MQKDAPVTVIIPCYQCANTIERAVSSVFNQTLRPHEVILVDDYSNDGTLKKLYKLSKSYPENWIKVVEQTTNLGPGSARNRGWDLATQDYIAFLDADDSWHPEKISIQYSWMNLHKDIVLTGHNSKIISGPKSSFAKISDDMHSQFYKVNKYKFLMYPSLGLPTRSIMLKRNIDFRFIEGVRYSEDANLLMRIFFSDHLCMKTNLDLAYSYKEHFGDSGLSSNILKMQKGIFFNYKYLYEEGKINKLTQYALSSLSLVKFSRRVLLTAKRKYID